MRGRSALLMSVKLNKTLAKMDFAVRFWQDDNQDLPGLKNFGCYAVMNSLIGDC